VSLQDKKTSRKRGVILRAIASVSKAVYSAAKNGMVGRFLSGYDQSCERFYRAGITRLVTQWHSSGVSKQRCDIESEILPEEAEGIVSHTGESMPRSLRHRFSKKFDESLLVTLIRSVKEILLNTPLVTYGLMLFGFALLFLLSQALILIVSAFGLPLGIFSYVMTGDTVLTVTYMAVAVVLMALSLILVFAQEGSLYAFLLDSRLMGSLMRGAMGIRRTSPPQSESSVLHRKVAFLIGSILGVLTFFITPYHFFSLIITLLIVASVISLPEFGLVLTIVMLPYFSLMQHPTLYAGLFAVLVLISTLLKLMLGRRTLRLQPLDLLVGFFLLMLFIGGVVTVGGMESFRTSLSFVTFGLLYFAVVILIKDIAWLKRILISFVISGIPIAIMAILEFVLGKAATSWQDTVFFSNLSGRAASLWGNPNVLAEFLLVTFFASFGLMLIAKQIRFKFMSAVAMAINAAALIFTWSRGAWLALVVTLIFMLLVYSYKSLPWVLLGIAAFITLSLFLPQVFLDRLESIVSFSDSSTLYRIHIWQGCSEMIRDTFLTGIGIGPEAFGNVYPSYALDGIEVAPHSHNLLMQIVIELGLVGLLVFLTLMLQTLRAAFTLFAKCSLSSAVSVYALALLSALIALFENGMTDYIWYNHRIYAIFFVLIGLIRSACTLGLESRPTREWEAEACELDILLCR